MRKHHQWKETWALQRKQDAGETVATIPVPPKYTSADFQKPDYWRLRGKLDVPRERFVSLPGSERDADRSLPILWAGWDHLQRAKALAAYYLTCKDTEGWPPTRLVPLLDAMDELLPWLLQWYNAIDSETGERLGNFYEVFLAVEKRALHVKT
jgi:hypothetical protein